MNLESVKLRKLDDLSVAITLTGELKFRIWLAIRLFKMAMWVLGGKTHVDIKADFEVDPSPRRPTIH